MGINTSEFNECNKIDFSEWQEITRTPTMMIMRNKNTKEQAELHNIILKQTDNFNQEMATYFKRKNPQFALVKVYGVKVDESQTSFICKQRIFLKVLTQRILIKFSEIPQLCFPQLLYLLIQLLKGCRVIYKETGIFNISRNMIGVNRNSQVRMWANQNYAVNHPNGYTPIPQTLDSEQVFSRQQYRNIFAKASKNENKMINRIVQLVQTKAFNRKYPQQFEYLLGKSSNSFQDVIQEIQRYCIEKKIVVPQRLSIQVQNFQKVRKSNVGPMKSFKKLRKNQNKAQKAVFSRKENAHLHEKDYFLTTFAPQQGHLAIKSQRSSTNFTPLRHSTDRSNQLNYLPTKVMNKKFSPFAKSCKKEIESFRGYSTPNKIRKRHESEQVIHSPSFIKNKNKQKKQVENEKNQSPLQSKTKVSKKRSVSSKGKNTNPFFSKKDSASKEVFVRKTYQPHKNTSSIDKSIRNTESNRFSPNKPCKNNNKIGNYFLYQKPQKPNQEKRSISFDVMNLKIALHSLNGQNSPILNNRARLNH